MSSRLLFKSRDGDEPVSAVEVKLEPRKLWVIVRIVRSGPEHESLWVLPTQLHLEGKTFSGFVDVLATLPGWLPEFKIYMVAGIIEARRRATAVGTSAEAGAGRLARSRDGAKRSSWSGQVDNLR